MPIYQDKLTKQPEYRTWFISAEGPHGKWATMSVLDKRNMTQKDYDMTLFVNNNSSTGGKVFLGSYGGHGVAVKQVKKGQEDEALAEARITKRLHSPQQHPNVLMMYGWVAALAAPTPVR